VTNEIVVKQEKTQMRYKPRSLAGLEVALGGFPDTMRVEADAGIGVSARTVGELRRMTIWPENLAIMTPQERFPESTIKVCRASGPKRVSPKP
jgi:hypothetical protein